MQLIPQQQVPHHPPPANKPRPNAAAVPTISYQPTDIIIPTQLYDKIGNLGEYKRLQEAEKSWICLLLESHWTFKLYNKNQFIHTNTDHLQEF